MSSKVESGSDDSTDAAISVWSNYLISYVIIGSLYMLPLEKLFRPNAEWFGSIQESRGLREGPPCK